MSCLAQHNCAHDKIPQKSSVGVASLHHNYIYCKIVTFLCFLASLRFVQGASTPDSGRLTDTAWQVSPACVPATQRMQKSVKLALGTAGGLLIAMRAPNQTSIRKGIPDDSKRVGHALERKAAQSSGGSVATVTTSACRRDRSSGQHDPRLRPPEGREAQVNVAGPSGQNRCLCATLPPSPPPQRVGPTRRGPILRPVLRGTGTLTERKNAIRAVAAIEVIPRPLHRGNDDDPVRNSSTARAHCRPSRMAQTTSDWPRRMSPAAKTLGCVVA